MTASETGRRGEAAAVEYLLDAGFEICDRNWRSGRYEIDIVARRGGELHFVEVKTRKARGLTTPEQAMTMAKCRSMQHAVAAYLACRRTWLDPRFDLIAVECHPDGYMEVRFIPDAVEYHW